MVVGAPVGGVGLRGARAPPHAARGPPPGRVVGGGGPRRGGGAPGSWAQAIHFPAAWSGGGGSMGGGAPVGGVEPTAVRATPHADRGHRRGRVAGGGRPARRVRALVGTAGAWPSARRRRTWRAPRLPGGLLRRWQSPPRRTGAPLPLERRSRRPDDPRRWTSATSSVGHLRSAGTSDRQMRGRWRSSLAGRAWCAAV